jgi:hypothetical protein
MLLRAVANASIMSAMNSMVPAMEAKIDRIVELIRELAVEQYARGETDAIERLVTLARKASTPAASPSSEVPAPKATEQRVRLRAPKGAVQDFVGRVLAERPGIRPTSIPNFAQDDVERGIKPSSIRADLRKGAHEGRYREAGGKWFLIETPNGAKVEEAADPAGGHAASDLPGYQGDATMTP